MRIQTVVLTALTFVSLETALAAPQSGTGLEVTSHDSLRVVIERLSEKTVAIGLTEKILKDKIELRLRRNGITPTDSRASDHFLYLKRGTNRQRLQFHARIHSFHHLSRGRSGVHSHCPSLDHERIWCLH